MAKRKSPKLILGFIRKWHKPKKAKKTKKKEYISGTELRQTVTKQLGKKLAKSFELYIADGKYYCTPIEDAREVIAESKVDRKTWVRERFDCDDFAHVLKAHFAEAAYKDGQRRAAHCFGIVWGSLPGPHAINWMINSDGKLRFIEPQNDRIFEPRRTDKNIYFMLI
ncbi:MAG: lectin MOA-related protein [Planctomycetota bacterium]